MQAIYGNEQNPELFPKLTNEELELIADYGAMTTLFPGDVLYREGSPDHLIYVVLTGELHVFKLIGCQDELVAVHRPGDFAGDIALQIGAAATATVRPAVRSVVVQIETSDLHRIVSDHPELGKKILRAFARRSLELLSQGNQAEKLAALGRLAASIAHEINNPASVITSAVRKLRSLLEQQNKATARLRDAGLSSLQFQELERFRGELNDRPKPQASPVELGDRESNLEQWFDSRRLSELFFVAPAFVHHDVRIGELDEFANQLPETSLASALLYVHANLELDDTLAQSESAGERIVRLVGAVKDYTYMDRNPKEKVDVHQGIENTLTLLHGRLKHGIQVVRDFDPSLPMIQAHGGELNEVWTNLLINAADAMEDRGTLTVRTRRGGDSLIVEIEDTGHGIAPEIQNRIYEPFFTTKPPGSGTGLGLDISRRIIEKRHQGSISFQSRPGKTVFRVNLPLAQADAANATDASPNKANAAPEHLPPPSEISDRLTHPVSREDHTIESGSDGVDILVYGDYQCPFTRVAQEIITALLRAGPTSPIRYTYRHFPLTDMHPQAQSAAQAAEAAHLQGKFWDFHRGLLELRGKLGHDELLSLAMRLGLDIRQFEADRAGEATRHQVFSHASFAREDGIDITPSVFLDGRRYTGPIQKASLLSAVLRLNQKRA